MKTCLSYLAFVLILCILYFVHFFWYLYFSLLLYTQTFFSFFVVGLVSYCQLWLVKIWNVVQRDFLGDIWSICTSAEFALCHGIIWTCSYMNRWSGSSFQHQIKVCGWSAFSLLSLSRNGERKSVATRTFWTLLSLGPPWSTTSRDLVNFWFVDLCCWRFLFVHVYFPTNVVILKIVRLFLW